MKFLSSILIILSATASISDGRRATSSVASIPRSRSSTAKTAFINKQSSASSWTNNDVKEVRGGGGGGGTATMTNEMFNLVKAVVGVGVLSLPAGELPTIGIL